MSGLATTLALQPHSFIRAETAVLSPPLVPEIKLHLACEAIALWLKTEEELKSAGLPPPFWAFAWAGGQALARYVLDNAAIVRRRDVLDLASGSGLIAIAAFQAGAASVLASDIDPFSIAAIELNASLNCARVEAVESDLLVHPPPGVQTILVGDLFYEHSLASRLYAWLKLARSRGIEVLIGDPGRAYLPKDLEPVARYDVLVSPELEDSTLKLTSVWRMA